MVVGFPQSIRFLTFLGISPLEVVLPRKQWLVELWVTVFSDFTLWHDPNRWFRHRTILFGSLLAFVTVDLITV